MNTATLPRPIVALYQDLRIPDWSLSYLVNSDVSGLSEEDILGADKYFARFRQEATAAGGFFGFSYRSEGEGTGFTRHPAFGLACDCVNGTVAIYGPLPR